MRRNRRKQRMELRRPHTLVSALPKFKSPPQKPTCYARSRRRIWESWKRRKLGFVGGALDKGVEMVVKGMEMAA
ncbi:hypothetical protein FNV43_RR04465 [Rhamnella rubrinervis]|uniref:Uncharacterized protein n=1 Tax=Rhamnella rubrinervis TaxID=2594499 RepID=A0A8K0HJK9_9ROSA|nr:hypothetical protein FNV43_RR04465 [Rhamnella rubrinervis]